MARSPTRRIFYHHLCVQVSPTCSNASEVAKLASPSCSRPELATNNSVRDIYSRSNFQNNWSFPPALTGQYQRAALAQFKCTQQICVRSAGNQTRGNSSTRGNRLAYIGRLSTGTCMQLHMAIHSIWNWQLKHHSNASIQISLNWITRTFLHHSDLQPARSLYGLPPTSGWQEFHGGGGGFYLH